SSSGVTRPPSRITAVSRDVRAWAVLSALVGSAVLTGVAIAGASFTHPGHSYRCLTACLLDLAMATDAASSQNAGAGRAGARAESVLIALFAVALILLPVHIRDAYSGLPAHPLLLHIPVILLPVAIVGAVILALRPSLFDRAGVTLVAIAVV